MMQYQTVFQHNEEDCGAACLATIAKHYGRILSITHAREAVGTGQLGTTLLGLIRGAESLGFNARGVKTSPQILDQIEEFPLPAIIYWKGYHYVVFYGKKGKKFVIADPSVGIRYLDRKEFLTNWTGGITLLLEPDEAEFFRQENDHLPGLERFLRPVWSYRFILGQVLIVNLFLGILSLALPFLIQILTDDVLVRGDLQLLTNIVIAVIIMQSVSSGLDWVQSTLISHFAGRLELSLILQFGRKLLRLPLSYFESHRSGEIVSRLRDIEDINGLISAVVITLPSQLFIAIVSLALMLFYSARLTIIAVVFSVLMSLSTIILLPVLRRKVKNLLILEAENQGILVETFKGALTLKTLGGNTYFSEEFQSRYGRLANLSFRTIHLNIINYTFSGFVTNVGNIILLWIGSYSVIAGKLSIGQLLAFNTLNGNFLGFAHLIIRFIDEFVRVNTAVERLAEVIDATPENVGDSQKAHVNISPHSDIICEGVSYHYSGRLDLLQDFSLTIPGGEVTAIIGRSGCGKSTLAKLIAGLYLPDEGNIRLGSYNIADLSLDCLRQQVILVPQEAHFWSRSILENFRIGSRSLSFEDVVSACERTGAHEFISQLPDKYQTVLGEFGANLSGGQRQRLALARAIVYEPPILVLDESTSALDPMGEMEVLENLLQYRRGKTTLMISHRPSTIERAGSIVLLEDGRVKLQGSVAVLREEAGNHLPFLTA